MLAEAVNTGVWLLHIFVVGGVQSFPMPETAKLWV
jgi:hypothetical protein